MDTDFPAHKKYLFSYNMLLENFPHQIKFKIEWGPNRPFPQKTIIVFSTKHKLPLIVFYRDQMISVLGFEIPVDRRCHFDT